MMMGQLGYGLAVGYGSTVPTLVRVAIRQNMIRQIPLTSTREHVRPRLLDVSKPIQLCEPQGQKANAWKSVSMLTRHYRTVR